MDKVPFLEPKNGGTTSFGDARRYLISGRSIVRGAALAYAAYLFFLPAYRQSVAVWAVCTAFYTTFVILFFLAAGLAGRLHTLAFMLYFLFAFLYFPVNREAAGVFVYPFAMLCLFLTRLRVVFLVLAAMMAAVIAETHYFGHSLATAEEILCFCVIIGLSNFAFAQQERTTSLVKRANSEIARLSQEAERERIARDLHDVLGHTLTVITVKLDLARRLLTLNAERARDEIADAEQTARSALAEVRDAVSGYRAEGLDAEIGRARHSLLSAEVKLTTALAPVTLSPSHASALCLALREAVTNIVRHARATACRVTLLEEGGTLYFTVEDNGVGGPIREGNGLCGMRERLQPMKGAVKLAASGTGGTRLEITLPLGEATQTQAANEVAGEAS
jgi:two-component system, NarL family, sensor histidine kinase DesK